MRNSILTQLLLVLVLLTLYSCSEEQVIDQELSLEEMNAIAAIEQTVNYEIVYRQNVISIDELKALLGSDKADNLYLMVSNLESERFYFFDRKEEVLAYSSGETYLNRIRRKSAEIIARENYVQAESGGFQLTFHEKPGCTGLSFDGTSQALPIGNDLFNPRLVVTPFSCKNFSAVIPNNYQLVIFGQGGALPNFYFNFYPGTSCNANFRLLYGGPSDPGLTNFNVSTIYSTTYP